MQLSICKMVAKVSTCHRGLLAYNPFVGKAITKHKVTVATEQRQVSGFLSSRVLCHQPFRYSCCPELRENKCLGQLPGTRREKGKPASCYAPLSNGRSLSTGTHSTAARHKELRGQGHKLPQSSFYNMRILFFSGVSLYSDLSGRHCLLSTPYLFCGCFYNW